MQVLKCLAEAGVGSVEERFVKEVVAEHGRDLALRRFVFPIALFPSQALVFFSGMTASEDKGDTDAVLTVLGELQPECEASVVYGRRQEHEAFGDAHVVFLGRKMRKIMFRSSGKHGRRLHRCPRRGDLRWLGRARWPFCGSVGPLRGWGRGQEASVRQQVPAIYQNGYR